MRDWIQVSLLPRYRIRETILIDKHVKEVRTTRRQLYDDRQNGLTRAFHSLRDPKGGHLVFLRRADNFLACTPHEVDQIFTCKWQTIYEGTQPLHGSDNHVQECN